MMAELMAKLESWNQQAFLFVNASEHPAASVVAAANGIAQWGIFLVPLLLAVLWLWGNPANRTGLLLAFCGAEIALALNQIITLLWYHPRPFAVPIGHTLVEHVADSSFPSDHVTFIAAIGFGLLAWTRVRWAGWLVLAVAVPVGWSRLFLGVHFPLDMVGAIPVAATGILAIAPFRRWAELKAMPNFVEPIYRRLFALPIAKGWVRA